MYSEGHILSAPGPLYRNNVVPEQVLFDAGCTDYQDERAHIAIAEAAENLMRMGYESADDEDS